MGVFICRLNWIAFIPNKESKMQSSAVSPETLIKVEEFVSVAHLLRGGSAGNGSSPRPPDKTVRMSLESQGALTPSAPPLWFSARVGRGHLARVAGVTTKLNALDPYSWGSSQRCLLKQRPLSRCGLS